ncbi:MAG: HDIG domain-containing protein [Bdellovibrionaceae bacterium]|nr:HDIG domain-containing protein [Pseudobdellovibrionaceae bacterium]
MLLNILTYSVVGLFIGAILGFAFYKWGSRIYLKQAETEAAEMVDEAKELAEIKEIERNEKLTEIEMELWTKSEPDLLKIELQVTDLEAEYEERKARHDENFSALKSTQDKKHNEIRQKELEIKKKQLFHQDFKKMIKAEQKKMVVELCSKLNLNADDVKRGIADEFISDIKRIILRDAEFYELDVKEQQEVIAKRLLDIALDRFARPYCAERGIAPVYFPENYHRNWLVDADKKNLTKIQELTGCDIIVEPENDMIGVAGFDPVRRELTRRVLERLLKEKKTITLEYIDRTYTNQKNELFKQIKHDGDSIAKELKLENMHPEVKQMMGSLRFRYSFTQNQYFHCGEVGWLCGLLSSELGMDVKVGKRSGVLHDIGKSMDHAVDGGHAVIGANFIAKRGESAEVVHNVRAHHYDETPNSVHAFLVIAADAMSGGRPGARRSTLETYAQKVTELQEIARSFEGVTDCYVLSGGRECRVYVNNKKISDRDALSLSLKIAAQIEKECNYPGQIKVVVVRETIVQEHTMGKQKYKEEESV